ncbi:MAG: heme NO-binding domain-containing protein [Halobacteriales archaeon]|nr:heme NO-binding domain-containing protein [Halobacteriales archaeon]
MHGIIFAELKKYVVARMGTKAWNDLLAASGMQDKVFLPNQAYGDVDVITLVTTASRLTGKSASDILEDFGEFLAPDLLTMYRPQLDPAWRTLDIIENTEQLIHRQVRVQSPGALPPQLQVVREGPDKLRLTYTSRRQMCGVAKGIARGIAREQHEHIRVTEPECMLKGGQRCDIRVERVG